MKEAKKIMVHVNSPPTIIYFRKHLKQTIMKLFLTVFTLLTFSITANAQLYKGTWLTGGTGSFYSYNETFNSPFTNFTARYTTIDVAASVGYFIATKFAGGVRPTFNYWKGKATSGGGGGNSTTYQLAAGPFVRYYFLKEHKPFNLLTDISYQFGINKDFGTSPKKGKLNTFSVMGGTEVFFNTTAGLEILLGYSRKIVSIENPLEFYSIKNGLAVSIGFQLHLQNL